MLICVTIEISLKGFFTSGSAIISFDTVFGKNLFPFVVESSPNACRTSGAIEALRMVARIKSAFAFTIFSFGSSASKVPSFGINFSLISASISFFCFSIILYRIRKSSLDDCNARISSVVAAGSAAFLDNSCSVFCNCCPIVTRFCCNSKRVTFDPSPKN